MDKVLSCDFNKPRTNEIDETCGWTVSNGELKRIGTDEFSSRTSGPLSPSNIGGQLNAPLPADKESYQALQLTTNGKSVTFESPLVPYIEDDFCFQFDYYLFGPKGKIFLNQEKTNGGSDQRVIWYRDENHENYDKVAVFCGLKLMSNLFSCSGIELT